MARCQLAIPRQQASREVASISNPRSLIEQPMPNTLSNEVAVVTGGGRGIGRAIALSLSRKGARVGVLARTRSEIAATAAAIDNAGGRAMAIAVDVRDREAIRAAVLEVERHLGPISLLVNNAGTPGPAGHDWEVDPEAWFECVEVIVRGAFLASHAVLPGMIARGAGRIINVASVSGTRAVLPITATSIGKTALIRFTEGLAGQLRALGVCVFAIHPGIVRTRLLESYRLQIPADLFVAPARAGSLCARLASGRYDILSGCFLRIEDDLEVMLSRADEAARYELYTLRIKTKPD
jgi:3-oxoacyl-[acyl-carrier protein] reductase